MGEPREHREPRRWSEAMETALYGPAGFFRLGAPADHFRTSVHVGPVFAAAIAELLGRVDSALGRPERLDLVDVGAGRGELVLGVAAAVPVDLRKRLRMTAVELADRPDGLDPDIAWAREVPAGIVGLLIATEWLDNVPLDIAVRADDDPTAWHYLLVDDEGTESVGGPLSGPDLEWVGRWWPRGERVEIGRSRDEAWTAAVEQITAGLAVAVDYGHTRAERPEIGTLSGMRSGRESAAIPNGEFDLSAHVAMDSLGDGRVISQREALTALGVSGRRPPLALASSDPTGYVRGLAAASAAAELTDPGGLGGHLWLLRPVSIAADALRMTA